MPPAIAPTMPRRSLAGSTRIVSTTAQSPHAGRAGAWATRGGAATGGTGATRGAGAANGTGSPARGERIGASSRGATALGGCGDALACTGSIAHGTAPRSSSKGSPSVERATSPSSCRVAITRLSARSRSRAAIT